MPASLVLALLPAARALVRRGRPAPAVLLAPLALALLLPGTALVPLLLLLGPARPPATRATTTTALASGPPPAGTIEAVTGAVPEPLRQLLRALEEAQSNCEAAHALTRGALPPPGAPLFRTTELESALLDNPWVADRALGEADTLLDEAIWLAALDPHAALGDRSWEDVRFLLGGIHWYLERAWDAAARSEAARRAHGGLAGALHGVPLPAPRGHVHAPESYDRRSLREYHDLRDFEDLLGRWD